MRAVRVVRHGEPTEAIEVGDDVEVPESAPGQARVAGEGVEEWVGRRVVAIAGGPDKTALCADLGARRTTGRTVVEHSGPGGAR